MNKEQIIKLIELAKLDVEYYLHNDDIVTILDNILKEINMKFMYRYQTNGVMANKYGEVKKGRLTIIAPSKKDAEEIARMIAVKISPEERTKTRYPVERWEELKTSYIENIRKLKEAGFEFRQIVIMGVRV